MPFLLSCQLSTAYSHNSISKCLFEWILDVSKKVPKKIQKTFLCPFQNLCPWEFFVFFVHLFTQAYSKKKILFGFKLRNKKSFYIETESHIFQILLKSPFSLILKI